MPAPEITDATVQDLHRTRGKPRSTGTITGTDLTSGNLVTIYGLRRKKWQGRVGTRTASPNQYTLDDIDLVREETTTRPAMDGPESIAVTVINPNATPTTSEPLLIVGNIIP